VVTENAANMVKAFRSYCELFDETQDAEESSQEQLADRAVENGDKVSNVENVL